MIFFPNAKINLGLQVVSKRSDGYHNLESVFYPVAWQDALEIIPADSFHLSNSGIVVDGDCQNNLCYRAYLQLKTKFQLPDVHIHLHKNIPIGAGLGGGSADAAFTVKALNTVFDLNLGEDEMVALVRPLGSDCAFFIRNIPVLALGRGDEFKPISLSLEGTYIILIHPGIFISTQEAYAGVVPSMAEKRIHEVIEKGQQHWQLHLKNDFEHHLFKQHPLLPQIKQQLYEAGAFYASMSGSGSCMYGLFDKLPESLPVFPDTYRIWTGVLS